MHVQAELVGELGGGRNPRRIHRCVEFHRGEVGGLDFPHRIQRFFKAGDGKTALRRQRPLPVDDDRVELLGADQKAFGPPVALRYRQFNASAGIARGRHPQRHLTQRIEVVGYVHVAIPQAGDEGLPGPVDDPRAGRKLGKRGTDADDLATRHDHILTGNEPFLVGIVDFDVAEQHGLT